MINKVNAGLRVENIGEALALSLENKKPNLSPSSFKTDKQKIRHLINWIGHNNFKNMTQSDWNKFIAQLQAKYAASTVNQYLTLLRAAIRTAIADGIINDDPLKLHKTMIRAECEKYPFTEKEINALLFASNDHPFEVALIQFGISTGMRICELMAISQECYDPASKTYRIDQALVNGQFKSPKNAVSLRVIELTRPAIAAIETLINLSVSQEKEDYQFLNPEKRVQIRSRKLLARSSVSGKPYSSVDDFRNKFFVAYCRLACIPFRGPSNFRHTFASQMLTANAPIQWVIDTMGHADYATLKKHYAVWINEQDSRPKELALEHLDRLFDPLNTVIETGVKTVVNVPAKAVNDEVFFNMPTLFSRICKFFRLLNKVS